MAKTKCVGTLAPAVVTRVVNVTGVTVGRGQFMSVILDTGKRAYSVELHVDHEGNARILTNTTTPDIFIGDFRDVYP